MPVFFTAERRLLKNTSPLNYRRVELQRARMGKQRENLEWHGHHGSAAVDPLSGEGRDQSETLRDGPGASARLAHQEGGFDRWQRIQVHFVARSHGFRLFAGSDGPLERRHIKAVA
jgi:hypothetical protein